MPSENVYVVMPAYNEEANIEQVVGDWYPIVERIGNGSRLVVVDDGSKDSTLQRMQRAAAGRPLFTPVTKPNSGHGATVLHAYRLALEAKADWIFQTDSDGQTVPEEFWKFWEERQGSDLIVGSRTRRKDGFGRVVVSRVLKLFLLLMMRTSVPDANTPFRLIRAPALGRYMPLIPADFFLANVLVSVIFVRKGERCRWLPITFRERQGGVNSINFRRIFAIGLRAIKDFGEVKARL